MLEKKSTRIRARLGIISGIFQRPKLGPDHFDTGSPGEAYIELRKQAHHEERLGNWNNAAKIWTSAVNSTPENQSQRDEARTAQQCAQAVSRCEYDDAFTTTISIFESNPNHISLLYALEFLLGKTGDQERMTDIYKVAVNNKNAPAYLFLEQARMLNQLGRPLEATEALNKAATRYPGNRKIALQWIDALIRVGETERAERIIDECKSRFPDDFRFELLLASIPFQVGDDITAINLIHRVVINNPKHPYPLFRYIFHILQQGDLELARSEFLKLFRFETLPADTLRRAMLLAINLRDERFASVVLKNGFKHTGHPEVFTADVEIPWVIQKHGYDIVSNRLHRLDATRLGAGNIINLANQLNRGHFYTSAESQIESALLRFPQHPNLLAAKYFTLYFQESVKLEQFRKFLAQSLSKEQFMHVLCLIPAQVRTQEDCKLVLHQIVQDKSLMSPRRRRDNLEYELVAPRPGTEQILFEWLSGGDNNADSLHQEFIIVKIGDREDLDRSYIESVPWHRFKKRREKLAEAMCKKLSQSRMELQLQRAIQVAKHEWMFSGESIYDAVQLASWIMHRIAMGIPTSIVRLGDGEGNFLPYHEQAACFQRTDIEEVQQNIWWGSVLIGNSEQVKFMQHFQRVIENADLVGIPPIARCSNLTKKGVRFSRGLRAVLDYVDTRLMTGNPLKRIASHFFHVDLETQNLYAPILEAAGSVSVISCHDLAPCLMERHGISVRQWLHLPTEKMYSQMLQNNSPETTGVDIYPGIYGKIMDAIDPLPGELWLVAAGFLGKFMCNKIKELGGIAIDIGSVADYWRGFQTRRHYISNNDFDWTTCLIENVPVPEVKPRIYKKTGELWSSSASFRRNIHSDTSADQKPAHHKLRVIGHPRCGSGYTSDVLRCLGLEIRHEMYGSDGICSWLNTVENDMNPPWGPPLFRHDSFEITIAHIRDPATALPSIILENSVARSFNFRRLHILRELGEDIAHSKSPLHRAISSYVYWMEIVRSRSPLALLRIEYLVDDILACPHLVKKMGIYPQDSELEAARSVITSRNSSEFKGKYRIRKPSLQEYETTSIPRELLIRLCDICQDAGYPVPDVFLD